MPNPLNLAVALLLLRLSLAWVFLYAAFRCTSSKLAWSAICHETELFFPFLAPGPRKHFLGTIAAVIGMAMMYGGGLSVLLGIESRLGGLDIALFSLLGLRIHFVHMAEALAEAPTGNAMAIKAYSALSASANKNYVLIAAGLLFFLLGAGPYSLGIGH